MPATRDYLDRILFSRASKEIATGGHEGGETPSEGLVPVAQVRLKAVDVPQQRTNSGTVGYGLKMNASEIPSVDQTAPVGKWTLLRAVTARLYSG